MKKSLISLLTILSLVAFSGCGEPEQESTPPEDVSDPFTTLFTYEELAKHNTPESCWLLVEGNLYDVTQYVPSHPGGEAILKGCGLDATEIFNSVEKHTDTANTMLETYLLGPLE